MNRAILVKSCQRFRARQEACRETWADAGAIPGSQPWFIEGGHARQGFTADVTKRELRVTAGDSYQDNSQKLREALSLLMQLYRSELTVFICDDDTFVHPRRWLAHEPSGDFECRLYHPKNHREHVLNYGRPWASGGSGWWMSRRMCELYVEHVTERCSYDDVLAARVAQDNHVEIVDRPDLYAPDSYSYGMGLPYHLCRPSCENTLITGHHVQPAEMVKLWEATREL